MLSALQRFTLRKWFNAYATKAGVDPQTIDFEALVDSQLSYAENKAMFQGLVLLPPDELAFTEEARAMEEQYRAHVEEQRNRAFHRLEEMFRLKPELGHPAFRQEAKTLQIWLRITDIRRVDVARVFLRKWGVRFEYRHATYQYHVKNSLGMVSKRNVQRCPPLFGIRIAYSLIGSLQDRLRDAGVNTVISGIQKPPFFWVEKLAKRYWFWSNESPEQIQQVLDNASKQGWLVHSYRVDPGLKPGGFKPGFILYSILFERDEP